MAKSKRDKKVSLTAVRPKKNNELKLKLLTRLRSSMDRFDRLFVFSIHNEKNASLKEARNRWRQTGEMFIYKNKVMAIALGREEATTFRPNTHLLAKLLVGRVGILATSEPIDSVERWFSEFRVKGFARSGDIATKKIILTQNHLNGNEESATPFTTTDVPKLRSLGIDVMADKGSLVLKNEKHIVCTENEQLSPEQARILQWLGHKLANFHLKLLARWNRQDNEFKLYDHQKTDNRTTTEIVDGTD